MNRRVIDRANAILRAPITTANVKAGDTLSAIAAASKQPMPELLAFPEDARSRANPGLIHLYRGRAEGWLVVASLES